MDQGKETYARKRGYSKVHVMTWTIHLEKDGFVPCSFQNCKFMAFNVVEMKNHYNTCKGEGFQAAYECKYCKGRTEHADKLEEHIVRYHGHEAEHSVIETNTNAKSSKEPDEDIFQAINGKSEISKVVIYSWNASKEMYGYIKCRDCCLLSDEVEDMKSHLFTCQKNPSAFPYECQKCNGRVANQTTLDCHMAECHKDAILGDDNFIEKFSNFWKEQIDMRGFAKCGERCKFVHTDCSKIIKHFKASCSMEAGCQAVMYCDTQSCCTWSTSKEALLKHQKTDHILKASDFGETGNIKEVVLEQNSKSRKRNRKLTQRISDGPSFVKCDPINKLQPESKDVSLQKKPIEELQKEIRKFTAKRSVVWHSTLETEGHNTHSMDNSSEREATKSPSEPIPENNQVHCSKEVSEDRPINDDLYQLKSSTVKTEITIEDPLSFESEDHIFFTKQSDYSRLEDGASNKMKKILISDDEDDDSTLEIKPMGLIDKNRKSCSKVADTSPNNLKESDKNDSLSPEQDTKTKLKDSGKLVTNETNRLYGKKYGRKSNLIKENSGTVRSGDVFLTNDLSHGNIEDEKDCHVSKNKRGRPKNIGSKKKEDLTENHMVSPQKQFRSERLRKLSRGLDPDMEEELLTTSIQDRKVLAENESFKVMTSDLNSIETTFPAQDDLQNSCEVQKLKETSKAINLSSMSQDESTTIKKKRGRPRKNRGRSSGSNPSKNSQDEYFSTHLSQEKIGEYEKNDSNLENQIEKAGVSEEVSHLKPKGIEDETVEISCNTNFKEMKLSITQNDTPSIESDHKKISSDMGETLVGVTPTSDNSGKGVVNSEDRLRKLKNHSEEEELQFPEPERIPKEPGVSWAKKNFSDGKGEKIARFIESPHVALKIVEKRETPKESISVSREDSTKVLSNQKKHGRPRKDSPGLISTPGKSETTETEEGKEHIKMSDEAKKQSNWAIKLKSNSSFHDDVLVVSSSAKKYGRSRQDSLNFECQSEKVVTTPPVHEKEKSFRDCIGEAGKDLEKCEPIKPMQVEKHVEESEEMSYETNDQTKELKTPPSVDNSRNKSETSKKKRGRPKKIISYPHEDAPSNQNKGEEPRENDFESVRNSEKNVPGSSTGWEEIESFKDDIGVDENNIKDSEVVKAQKTEETRDDLVAMSSETNNPVIELETTPPSLDNSNNKAETIRKKQGKAKSAPEDSTSVPVSPKKLKNPKEKSLDSERNSGKVVPISPGLQETENFKDDIGEERKIMNESVQIKPQEIGGNRDDNVSISSETKCLAMELEATPSSLVNLQNEADPIKKKRGRSKKIISSSHEDTTNIQASPKKRGGSRESNLNSVRKLEEVLPASPVQEEREHFENVIGGVEENMEDSESTCSKRNEIREETEKLTNVPTYVPTCNDNKSSEMYSNEMKSITSPKEDSSLNVGKDQSQSKTIDDTGTLEKHSEGGDSKLNKQTKIDEQINEDLDVDDSIMPTQEGIEEENVEINDMSSVQDQKPEELGPTLPSPSTIKKKRGRPKKRKLSQEDNVQIGKSKPLGSTLDDSNIEESKILVGNTIDENPNNDSCGKSAINDELSISSTRPEQRIKKKPRSTRETGTVHKKTSKGNNESVLEVQSISEVSGQLNASSVSSIPSISTRKKRGHPKKTSTISGSTNDPEPHQKEEVMSKRKRTSKKPFKLSSYVTDNSDFESTLDDTEEGLSKVAESSTIADNSEVTLKSSSAPQALKRRPGRPKKIINTALDVSVDAENFNKSLETKQGLFSTPRNRQRSVSTPKKYKDYTDELSRISSTSTSNLSKEIQDVNEGSADQKGEKDLSRKRKRRSRLSSDDFFYPEIEAKDRKVPKNPEHEGTKDKTNEENIEMEPVDKVENHLSPEIVKPRKNKPPGRQVKKVTCSVCKQSFSRLQYEVHAADHNYFCWVEGEREYDFEKEDDMHSAFYVFRKFKNFKGLKCEKCGIYKKSSVGFISHRTMCGISDIEKEMLKVPCPVCKRFMLPSSLKVHMGTDHRPNTKVSIDEIEVPGSSKRAAAIRAGTILEETKLQEEDANESEEVKAENLRKWYRYKKRAVTLVREELNPDENNELHCPEQNCSFKSDDLDSLQAHHSQCTKLHMDYECRICTAGFKELHLINEHILANHKEVVENDATDMEFEVDSQKEEYDEEEEQQQPTQESTIFGRPNFLKQEYSRSGLNFIYRNLQRNHDRLHTSHAQGSLLYSDLLAVANGFLNEEDLLSYIPNTLQSMKISLDGNNWEKLKFMEGRATEDASYVFVGGPVWAMDWCPSSTTDDHQWLAVSCHRDMDALHQMGQVFSYNNLIQIWDFGAINLLSSRMEVPSLSIGIAHSEGTAWDVRWCPDGCHQPDTGRLGLLAAAFSSGAALIYSVPLVTTERGKPFYKLNPVIELISPHDEPVQCCRIAWSCESPFNIVAVGYEDGSVSLYDITTSSLLLKEGTKVHPYKVFTAHVDCITGLQFIANRTGRNLMTCSMDRALTFWNLQDTSTPITCNKKVPVRNAIWMDNWLCAVSVYDDCYTTGVTHLNVNNFRDFFYLVPVPWLGVNNTNWSVTASDWSNSIAMSSEIGEVYAVYPSQLFYVDAKAVKRNSMYITSTVLKKLNSEGIEDKKNEKLDTAGPSTYKHAADNFGLVFTESRGAADGDSVGRASLSKNLFPITSINKVSYNPNRHAFTYLAIGHQCGVLRVVRDHHFDFVKDEMFKFGQSLLMR